MRRVPLRPLAWALLGALIGFAPVVPEHSLSVARADDQGAGDAGTPDQWIDEQLPGLLDLYRHLHSHPELSFSETETAARIAEELRQVGAEVTTGVGRLGVVGVLRNGDGPTVLVRTDLDALPIVEQTGLPYASRVKVTTDSGEEVGVMHACGHDMHMASFVGTARWLADHRDRWAGTVLFVAQPAEEVGAGARAMLEDGLYDRFPRPDFALALHVAHNLEAGRVGYTSGPALAGVSSVDLLVRGVGGHGAMPHETVDPIVLASLLVLDLQTVVSREVRPIDSAVLTVGSIHGGTKHNIIPPEVSLQLTLRYFDDAVRDLLVEGIRRRALALAEGHRAPEPTVAVESEGLPPTINTPALVDRLVPALSKTLGEENVVSFEPTMGAEDFGLYGRAGVPSFMFRLGTAAPEKVAEARSGGASLPSIHSPFYAPVPEPSLRTGIRAMTAAVVELIGSK